MASCYQGFETFSNPALCKSHSSQHQGYRTRLTTAHNNACPSSVSQERLKILVSHKEMKPSFPDLVVSRMLPSIYVKQGKLNIILKALGNLFDTFYVYLFCSVS